MGEDQKYDLFSNAYGLTRRERKHESSAVLFIPANNFICWKHHQIFYVKLFLCVTKWSLWLQFRKYIIIKYICLCHAHNKLCIPLPKYLGYHNWHLSVHHMCHPFHSVILCQDYQCVNIICTG